MRLLRALLQGKKTDKMLYSVLSIAQQFAQQNLQRQSLQTQTQNGRLLSPFTPYDARLPRQLSVLALDAFSLFYTSSLQIYEVAITGCCSGPGGAEQPTGRQNIFSH